MSEGARTPQDPAPSSESPTPPLRNDYPKGAVHEAIGALELAYSYLREKPAVEEKLILALDLLYRARELSEGLPHPYRRSSHGAETPLRSERTNV